MKNIFRIPNCIPVVVEDFISRQTRKKDFRREPRIGSKIGIGKFEKKLGKNKNWDRKAIASETVPIRMDRVPANELQ